MKTFLMSVILFGVFTSNLLAQPVEKQEWRCDINRSYSILVDYEVSGGVQKVFLDLVHFTGSVEPIAEFENPEVVNYGDTFMLLKNNGRSGFVAINIKRDGDDKEGIGFIDINLFNNYSAFIPNTRCVALD